MSRSRSIQTIRVIRVAALCLFGAFLVLIACRFYSEFHTSRERGRFVTSILEQHLQILSRVPSPKALLQSQSGWSDESLDLQSWIVIELIRKRDPDGVLRDLLELAKDRSYSEALKTSISRWSDSLVRWSRHRAGAVAEPVGSADPLLELGRQRHHEATGYLRIGRSYDASVLYLWSTEALREFVKSDPLSPEIPEALYLMGESLIRLRRVFPRAVRGDRLLNLCAELYPGTVWGARAATLWRDVMSDGV